MNSNHKVFVRCNRQIRIVDLIIVPEVVMVGATGELKPGVVVGSFEMNGVDTPFVREVIAYGVNEGHFLEDTIAHEPGDTFIPATLHWRIPDAAALRNKLGW